jgi:nucleoside-diphosphate-sugar epimerase
VKYVRSKALAEREIRKGISRGLSAVIVNPSNMMGRYDLNNWARLFRLVAARRLLSVPAGGGSFCHGGSVAQALIAAGERGQLGQNYLLGGADTSYWSLVESIAARLHRRAPLVRLPLSVMRSYAGLEEWIAPIFRRAPEITRDAVDLLSQNFYCSSRRAIDELAYQPVPLERMLEETQCWLEECGLLRKRRRG